MKRSMIILYVADQERSKIFYQTILKRAPVLHVPGMTEFVLSENFLLGLMPESGIVKILKDAVPDPAKGKGIPRCELYLFNENPSLALQMAIEAGAKEISKSALRNWGNEVSYCADPDGHIVAFAK